MEDNSCEAYFLNSNKSWSILLTMCIGCKKEDPSFPNLEEEFFKEYKNRHKILPTATTMRQEVIRRSKILGNKKSARPAGWNKGKCLEYLKKTHTFTVADVNFLIEKENEMHLLLRNAKEEEDEIIPKGKDIWRGELPFLRLYMCVVHDSVRPAYL